MRRPTALLSALTALGLLAAACTSGSSSSTTPNAPSTTHLSAYRLVSATASKTAAAKTAKMALTATIRGGGRTLSMTGGGEFDTAGNRVAMAIRVPTPQGTFTLREIMTGTTMYMRFPAKVMQHAAPGKSWVKIDLHALTGMNPAVLSQSPNAFADPTQALNELRGVSRNVEDRGTQTVRGVSAHHYHIVIDLRRAASQLPASVRCAFRASTRMIGRSTLPADVWIDSQGRLRRMSLSLQFPAMSGTSSGLSTRMVMDLYDFGTPVHVQAPPASEVKDITAQIAGHSPQFRACTGTPSA